MADFPMNPWTSVPTLAMQERFSQIFPIFWRMARVTSGAGRLRRSAPKYGITCGLKRKMPVMTATVITGLWMCSPTIISDVCIMVPLIRIWPTVLSASICLILMNSGPMFRSPPSQPDPCFTNHNFNNWGGQPPGAYLPEGHSGTGAIWPCFGNTHAGEKMAVSFT